MAASEGNLARHFDSAILETGDLVQRALKLDAALSRKEISGSSEDGIVAVKVNGHGRIMSLNIGEDALKYPGRLGRQLTVAIARARRTARALSEKAQARYIPELPSEQDLQGAATPGTYERVDFHAIDFDGPVEVRNEIAEAMESALKVDRMGTYLREHRLRQEISPGAGYVDRSIDGSHLVLSIDTGAPNRMGLRRLEQQVLEALNSAQLRANCLRRDYLDSIQFSSGSLGSILRSTEDALRSRGLTRP